MTKSLDPAIVTAVSRTGGRTPSPRTTTRPSSQKQQQQRSRRTHVAAEAFQRQRLQRRQPDPDGTQYSSSEDEGGSPQRRSSSRIQRNDHHLFMPPASASRIKLRANSGGSIQPPPNSLLLPRPSSSNSSNAENHIHRNSFLTLALLKLNHLSTTFCEFMAHPSYKNACTACACLDSSVATASGGGNVSPHSPRRTAMITPSSPTRSPLLNWIASATSRGGAVNDPHTATSFSALALEGEWEEFQRPFLLFAAAEVMYADFRHADDEFSNTSARRMDPLGLSTTTRNESKPAASSLRSLYQLLESEFIEMRRKLCVPFLVNPTSRVFNENKYAMAAASFSDTCLAFVDLCRCRANLIDAQSTFLFGTSNPKLYEEVKTVVERELCTIVGGPQQQNTIAAPAQTSAAFRPIQESLKMELEAWRHLLMAAWSLERCLFLESIVSLRQLQKTLGSGVPKDTTIYQWMVETLQSFRSLLPIYFDRVHVFASPMYNFETKPVTPVENKNWNRKVLNFLRKQEKLGGPDTVVIMLLDAVATNNLHVERGFFLSPHKMQQQQRSNGGIDTSAAQHNMFDTRVLWPAVYMRSTMTMEHHSPARDVFTSGSNLSRLNLRGVRNSAQSAASLSQVVDDSCNMGILEYGPDPGTPATSWPHCDWVSLTALIAQVEPATPSTAGERNDEATQTQLSIRMKDNPLAMSYRKDGVVSYRNQPLVVSSGRARAPSTGSAKPVDPTPSFGLSFVPSFGPGSLFFFKTGREDKSKEKGSDRLNSERPSEYHVVSLGSFLSFAVVVKPEENELGSFLRRRARIPDDEIRAFLDELADDLRVSQRFSPACFPSIGNKNRRKSLPLLDLPDVPSLGMKSEILLLLKQIKKSFGLRPSSPLHDLVFDKTRRRRGSSLVGDELHLNLSQSAAALFLGDQLAALFANA